MLIMISCRHASELMSQQLERKLSFSEKLRLHTHLFICKSCTKTLQKFEILREAGRRYAEHEQGLHAKDVALSPATKQRMLDKLQARQSDIPEK